MMTTIQLEKKTGIAKITLNRPEVRNAMNSQMIQELTDCLRELSKDSHLRVVQLCGAGKSFCAGADLQWMKSMVDYSLEENKKDSTALYELFVAIEDCPVPVVSYVHGHVMGGALGLVASSDIVIAEAQTKFCFSEVKLGLAPAVISGFVAEKAQAGLLQRWFLTAEIFSSAQAKELGLVQEELSAEEGLKMFDGVAQAILNNGPQAVRRTKALLKEFRKRDHGVSEKTIQLISELRVSAEGQEGMNSFFEKRSPHWQESPS